ncbi:S8 family serine peptidase [Lysobacter sp. Root604]|uniref:S8 family serine peptidase n=1 Tax=Lysobacter sp. Root604 TaxID=1736568 RepID=UPI0006F969FC|nr:S8 family serine peptidase [Lysobacter sp. Root604]KRA14872.1 hypothetical protein ASD69_18525 [Lysobacter sp. Root604]
MSNSNSNLRVHVLAAATALALAAIASPAAAGQAHFAGLKAGGSYSRFIVKYKDGSSPAASSAALSTSLSNMAARTILPAASKGKRVGLKQVRRMLMPGASVIASDQELNHEEAAALMRQIAADPNVQFVQVDGKKRALAIPNDPNFGQQWHYADSAVGIRAPTAWNTSTGSGVVVAVIDSGIMLHNDLNANILPGYDMVTSTTGGTRQQCADVGALTGCGKSDDGNGRDADPTDSSVAGTGAHGTHVAGTIAAVTNNGIGVAGVAYGAKVVPIRVLGNQGFGDDSDIVDAITWASGDTVPGVPANANPAKIINMSLGGSVQGSCANAAPAYKAAIDRAIAKGSVVIAAAGNDNIDIVNGNFKGVIVDSVPASCGGVISVAASNKSGSRSSFSSWGATIDITAPGGENVSGGGVLSTVPTNAYEGYAGTSMAAPHASGVAALIVAASPTSMTPVQIEQVLEGTARPIVPSKCSGGCGAGIIDAAAAVAAVSGGTPGNQAPVANFTSSASGLTVSFTDTSSDSDGSIASRSWSFGDGTNSTSANPSKTYSAAGTYTVSLTVTDNGGASNTKTSTVTVASTGGTQTYSNTADVNIPDNNATGASSTITVSGRTGNAPSTAKVSVNVQHAFRGDLIVDLIAPDGSVYNLFNRPNTTDSTDHVIITDRVVNLSSEPLNGAWKLRVADRAPQDVGYINSWSVTF